MITVVMYRGIYIVLQTIIWCFCPKYHCSSFPLRYFPSYAWMLMSKSHTNTSNISLLVPVFCCHFNTLFFSQGIAASKAWKQRFPGLHCSHYCSLLLVAEQKQARRLWSRRQSGIQNLEINRKLQDFENGCLWNLSVHEMT